MGCSATCHRSGKVITTEDGTVLTDLSGNAITHTESIGGPMFIGDWINSQVAKFSNIVISSSTFSTVSTVQIQNAPAGTYEYVASFLYSNPDTNDSIVWRVLGTFPSPGEVRLESKDVTDVFPASYVTEFNHTGGDLTFVLECRKEDISASDITLVGGGTYLKRVR